MNQAFSKIWIIVILIAFIAGGILAWQYFREVEKLDIEEEVKIPTEEEIKTEEKIEELEKKEGWLRVFNYQADVNNDGIDEFFVLEKSREEATFFYNIHKITPDLYYDIIEIVYDIVAFFEDEEKRLFEVWRGQVAFRKLPVFETPSGMMNISVGDIDKNGTNEILITIASTGFLFEYNKDGVKLEEKSKFTEIITRIMDRKGKEIDGFWYWSFEGIGDYNQDGVDEILTRYWRRDEMSLMVPVPGSIIPIPWEEIKEEKRIIKGETLKEIEYSKERLPRFEDFPVKEIFEGIPASVDFLRSDCLIIRGLARAERGNPYYMKHTIINEAKKGPNFAGHYTVVSLSAGAFLNSTIIVNAKTGVPKWGPNYYSLLNVEFQIDSNLFIVHPPRIIDGELDFPRYFTRYYKWENNQFVLLWSTGPKAIPF